VAEPYGDRLEVFARWADGHPKCPEYIGLPLAEAIQMAESSGRAEGMRVMDLDSSGPSRQYWTMDLRPNRLNMVVRDGAVIAAALF
jgi:hypothetical protein